MTGQKASVTGFPIYFLPVPRASWEVLPYGSTDVVVEHWSIGNPKE